jgi:hypothetical protein
MMPFTTIHLHPFEVTGDLLAGLEAQTGLWVFKAGGTLNRAGPACNATFLCVCMSGVTCTLYSN